MFPMLISMFFLAPRRLKKVMAEYLGSYNMLNEFKHMKSSKDVLENIFKNLFTNEKATKNHRPCSIGSSIKLFFLKSVLENAKS